MTPPMGKNGSCPKFIGLGLRGSKFVFRDTRNRPSPAPRIAVGNIPSVYSLTILTILRNGT